MKKILLIQTGGTIAMHLGNEHSELDLERFTELLHNEMPELQKIAAIELCQLFFEDSSDIHPSHWTQLATCIEHHIESFDGFVILHGTDTMAYTTSALSFALQHLHKPVIFTGSQVPMSNIRSDARRNLINAVELATLPLNEVAICFNDKLYRGNRSTKISIGDFDAFASPNFPTLADIGTTIDLHQTWKRTDEPFCSKAFFSTRVWHVKLMPGMMMRPLYDMISSDKGVVIVEAFGSGNIPVKDPVNVLAWIEYCYQNGWQVIITSQAVYDAVNLHTYAGGAAAAKAGALSAGDMTFEATLTKVMYLMGLGLDSDTFRNQFMLNLRGERSF